MHPETTELDALIAIAAILRNLLPESRNRILYALVDLDGAPSSDPFEEIGQVPAEVTE